MRGGARVYFWSLGALALGHCYFQYRGSCWEVLAPSYELERL